MKNKKITDQSLIIGIAGLGNIGKKHLNLLLQNPLVKVVSICDTDKKQNPELADISFTTSFDELLKNDSIQLINICTPHNLHTAMSIAAMKAGKHVLVEKPMCLTTADAKKMVAASKKYNRKLIVVKQNRYNQPVLAVDELLSKNKLGKIIEAHCHVLWNRNDAYYQSDWRGKKATEGGALFTQGSHFIDLLIHWLGKINKATTWKGTLAHRIAIDDSGSSTVEFENKTIGKIIWSNNVYQKNYEGSITLFGEKGTVKIGGQYLNTIEYWHVKNTPPPLINHTETIAPNLYNSGYQGSSSHHHLVFNDVIDLILHGKNVPLVQGDEAIACIAAIEKIYKGV